jgi:hypothetical protein
MNRATDVIRQMRVEGCKDFHVSSGSTVMVVKI